MAAALGGSGTSMRDPLSGRSESPAGNTLDLLEATRVGMARPRARRCPRVLAKNGLRREAASEYKVSWSWHTDSLIWEAPGSDIPHPHGARASTLPTVAPRPWYSSPRQSE